LSAIIFIIIIISCTIIIHSRATEIVNHDIITTNQTTAAGRFFSLPSFLFISELLTNPDYCDSIDYRNSLWRIRYERKAF